MSLFSRSTPLPAPPGGLLGWAVVDVETTGLRHQSGDRVVQIAVTALDASGRTVDSWSSLVDPGRDPGPTHIHGISSRMLQGAPRFAEVLPRLQHLLRDRVFVAHNAPFDWGFLANEACLAGGTLPTSARMCTMVLARRLELPSRGHSLAALAAHYHVQQLQAHNAQDDARVLSEILVKALADAARSGTILPVSLPEHESWEAAQSRWAPKTPKVPCSWVNPGSFIPGSPLVQGMRVAMTGDMEGLREPLEAAATAAGLDVSGNVSRKTSLLVASDMHSGSGKTRKAIECGTPVLTPQAFQRLLGDVRPGALSTAPARKEPKPATGQTKKSSSVSKVSPGPLHKQRILVLGGASEEAAALRERIAELGGSAAVNVTASVSRVVCLQGAEADKRYAKAVSLDLELVKGIEPGTNTSGEAPPADLPAPDVLSPEPDAPVRLVRGAVSDLPSEGTWTVEAHWNWEAVEVDLVAFALENDETVAEDADFVFYNQPSSASGTVVLEAGVPGLQRCTVALGDLPSTCTRIAIAAVVSGEGTFADVGPIEVLALDDAQTVHFGGTLDAASSERTMLLAEVYRRGDLWRLRMVGQGYDTGLAELATLYGVSVEG